ncbi:MAG: hypothetical protein N4A46_11155, partial [Schleiferiaceae bacterium]|nr:hypothetical protein [Schleiferiaceae bacterium]
YRENEGFQCEKGLSIIEDDAHHIWCASLDGLVCFNDNGFEGLPFVENAIAYVPKNDHDIWVYSSFNDDVVRFQDGDMINYDFSQNFEHSPISMYEDSKGNTWFGSFSGNGLLKFDGEYTYAYDHSSGLSNPWVPTIDEDLDGNIWLGTYGGGAVKFDGELFHIYEANLNDFFNETYLFSQSIISNKTTSDGSVWMGAQGGLTQLKDGKYTTYRTADGFPLKYVTDIQEAPGGGVFVSGEAGVFHVKDDEVINLTTKYGFPFTVTYAVLMDDQGSLWANGGSQLAVRRKDGVVMVFNRQDGLRSAQECFFTQTDDGTIYIGGTPGNAINRDKLFKQDLAKKPCIRLYSVIVYDQHFGFRQAKVADTLLEDSIEHRNYAGIQFSGVNAFTEVPQNLVLPYNMNELNFGFSGYDWRAQDKLEYSYRLIGGNDQWSRPGKGQEAKYTNLDYGDYTFEVKVKNRYGVWSDVESYSFVITPPWWHTWWARALYVVALLLSVFAYVRWRTAALKQRQKELETEVELATIDIRKKKDQIEKEKERSDELLLNILPSEVADELKEKGSSDARLMDEVSVLFTDFKGFTAMSENLSPKQLVDDLHDCFSAFDKICEKHGIEKIKTIGDAYMAAAGIPTAKESHVEDVIEAALEIRDYIEQMKKKKAEAGELYFEIRIGVHTGPVVAGIVGIKKFQYDIWGDTVNTASRMESSGSPGKVNISDPAYQLIKDDARFTFEERGKVMAKGKGELTMWFVERKGE